MASEQKVYQITLTDRRHSLALVEAWTLWYRMAAGHIPTEDAPRLVAEWREAFGLEMLADLHDVMTHLL